MKKFLKRNLAAVLGAQVRRLRAKNKFKIIAVVGSIGKTSTKLAIAQVLQSSLRVQYQKGNYNDSVSIPLVFFGETMPSLWNIFSWAAIWLRNELKIGKPYPYDAVVIELGTDSPGQIAEFAKYIHADISVITAITPEHMEFFQNMENVAEEEWSVADFSDAILVNKDLCTDVPPATVSIKPEYYSQKEIADFEVKNIVRTVRGFNFNVFHNNILLLSSSFNAVSAIQLYSLCAGIAVAAKLGLSVENIKKGVATIAPVPGRLQMLKGIKNATIIDDTYNASPEAVRVALDSLYSYPDREGIIVQKIAILGSMNELGATSEQEHMTIGNYCDPSKLDLVVTIGSDANAFIAPAAKNKGCKVHEFTDATTAGLFIKSQLKEAAVILAKGSQNGVFAEEAVKQLLADHKDSSKLVRQSTTWLKKKSLVS